MGGFHHALDGGFWLRAAQNTSAVAAQALSQAHATEHVVPTEAAIAHVIVSKFGDHTPFYDVQKAGGHSHLEHWIPDEDLDAFNAAIVSLIEVVRSCRPITRNFRPARSASACPWRRAARSARASGSERDFSI
ncbi:hypothetical protein WN73_12860 [Bradyrhizobium sp. CCBAU 45394]|nr:hypothetical protein [Bradyrhizobium sp. CCBAU 45394]MDA9537185.1 hypothetical protein [Bradyrhizobium sp. CCBAU 21362]